MIKQLVLRQNAHGFSRIYSKKANWSRRIQNVQLQKKASRIPTVLAVASGATATCYLVDKYYLQSLIERSLKAVTILSWVAYRYVNAEEIKEIQDFHEVAASAIFKMLSENKGLYIKLGQAVANQGAVFPAAFQRHFVNLYDAAPADSWDDIDRLLRQSLGKDYETKVFDYINHTPVASALIAQVHKARLKSNGDEVAVKIQHPYIARQMPVDLAVYRLMGWVYSRAFKIPLTFMTGYIADQLIKETDFRIEAENSRKLTKFIDNDPQGLTLDIYVPKVYSDYTSRKVLVTEWIDGLSLTDKQKLIENYSLSRAMHQYIKIFARQIFEYGFVHSDPHPGNLLTRKVDGRQQLVILDHGLYVTLSDKFKQEYCDLWAAMLRLDMSTVNFISESWGVSSSEYLKAMVQLKPPVNVEGEPPNPLQLMREIFSDETKFPPDLLFLMRTMRMIQNMNQSMGSPANRINIFTKSALYWMHQNRKITTLERLSSLKSKVLIFVSDAIFWFYRIRQILLGDKYGTKGEGIEDYIEQRLRASARSMGIEIIDGM